MQTIMLDFSRKDTDQILLAKQGDVGRRVAFHFTDNDAPFTIPETAEFSLWYSGTSGEGNYSAAGDHSAFVINGNIVEVELITQMLAVRGGGTLCLVMSSSVEQGGICQIIQRLY